MWWPGSASSANFSIVHTVSSAGSMTSPGVGGPGSYGATEPTAGGGGYQGAKGCKVLIVLGASAGLAPPHRAHRHRRFGPVCLSRHQTVCSQRLEPPIQDQAMHLSANCPALSIRLFFRQYFIKAGCKFYRRLEQDNLYILDGHSVCVSVCLCVCVSVCLWSRHKILRQGPKGVCGAGRALRGQPKAGNSSCAGRRLANMLLAVNSLKHICTGV